eukprot:742978-Pleurochrysis_carterae.AAC.1
MQYEFGLAVRRSYVSNRFSSDRARRKCRRGEAVAASCALRTTSYSRVAVCITSVNLTFLASPRNLAALSPLSKRLRARASVQVAAVRVGVIAKRKSTHLLNC